MSLRIAHADWLQGKGASIALQIGAMRDPSIAQVPLLRELAETSQEHALYDFLSSANAMGRSLVAPAGVPDARVGLLRAALDALVKDADFNRDAATRQIPLHHGDWHELAGIIDRALKTDPAIVASATAQG